MALGIAAVLAAFPAAMAVTARGMPDVGGLVLVVCGLVAGRAPRPPARAAQGPRCAAVAPTTRRVAWALALTLFAMFAFRRWYAFAATGIAIMLAIEVTPIALSKGARFRWRDAVAAAAPGLLHAARASEPCDCRLAAELGRAGLR